MKIDIKSIVSTLSGEQKDGAASAKAVDIRKALGEEPEDKAASGESPAEENAEAEEERTEEEPPVGALSDDEKSAEDSSDNEQPAAEEKQSAEDEQPADDAHQTESAEPEPEESSEPEAAPEGEPEAAPEGEPEAAPDDEPEAASDESAASDDESETDEGAESAHESETDEGAEAAHESEPETGEPETDAEPSSRSEHEAEPARESLFNKEKLLAWGRSYGWLTGIAASFVILMVFMVVYTTMTPRQINATINGEDYSFTTEEYTVEGFLEDENIEICEEDYISVPLAAFIQDGISFEIKHATDFTVTADGKTKKYKTLDNTVQQALDDVGIKLGEHDIVKPSLDTMLAKNMEITVQRVIIKQEVVEEEVPFETIEKDDVTMNEGTSKVVTEGKDGKDKVTYQVKFIDGKESSRKEIKRETVTAAVDEVIANGTRVNYNGQTYSKKLVVKAYAYTGGGTTAMGTRARVGEIAVDPSVIPLGTNVYIEGVGARRAEDTGGNIKGNTIDIYMDTQSECLSWGVRYVTIYIQ